MNLYKLLTLNKHGDFEEVLFSSTLSYILNPKNDHELGISFLKKIVSLVWLDIDDETLTNAKVTPESSLGSSGSVDIFIELGNRVLAIEVKIWDRSAKNNSKENIPQIQRYCKHLAEKHKGEDWSLIYLIPNIDSPICMEEYNNANEKGFKNNVKIMTWNSFDENYNDANIIKVSIGELIEEILRENSEIPKNTMWILNSLYEILPELIEQIKDKAKFPTIQDLKKLNTWPIFDNLFSVDKRWPNPLHATVGIPYGTGANKASFKDNCLYRIRTTKNYYNKEEYKEENYPVEFVELEFWTDVVEKCKDELLKWMDNCNIDRSNFKEGYHLDSKKKVKVYILTIREPLKEKEIQNLNSILRIGFQKAIC